MQRRPSLEGIIFRMDTEALLGMLSIGAAGRAGLEEGMALGVIGAGLLWDAWRNRKQGLAHYGNETTDEKSPQYHFYNHLNLGGIWAINTAIFSGLAYDQIAKNNHMEAMTYIGTTAVALLLTGMYGITASRFGYAGLESEGDPQQPQGL